MDNSKYISKYLPTNDNIRESPLVFYKGNLYEHVPMLSNFPDKTFIIPVNERSGLHVKWSEVKSAKLFLCTTDISIGDQVSSTNGVLKGYVSDINQLKFIQENKNWYKVIKDISDTSVSVEKTITDDEAKNLIFTNES